MVFNIIGWLLLIEALFLAFPTITAIVYSETQTLIAFSITLVAALISGLGLAYGCRPKTTQIGVRDGLLLTALVWICFSIYGMFPFLITGIIDNVTDAFFEMMSGFTTTGASIFSNIEHLPKSILLWRALSQWVGGMGIILFTLAVLPMLNYKGGIQLFNAETTGITHDKIRPRISQTAKSLWLVYFLLTLILFVLLCFSPMSFFDAICHALTSVSTGGFSTKNVSIAYWGSTYIYVVITIFMFLGGTSFVLIYRTFVEDWRTPFRNDIFKWYLGLVVVASICFVTKVAIIEDSFQLKIITRSLFQTISIMTSTGLNSLDYENYGGWVVSVVFALMFFGASAGSTSGGAKIDRLVLVVRVLKDEISRTLQPNQVTTIKLNYRPVTSAQISKTMIFILVFLFVLILGAAVLSFFDVPTFDAIFTSLSVLSNIGIGHGITGTGGGYYLLPDVCKWTLAFEMLVGRLEVFTILIIFTKGFWKN